MCPVRISDDLLSAFLELEGPVAREVAELELSKGRVTFGIDHVALAQACEKGTGGKPVLVARGVAPRAAHGPRLELDIDVQASDGNLNAEGLAAMCNVHEGQSLGHIHPALAGQAGTGVDGIGLEGGVIQGLENPLGVGVLCTPGIGQVDDLSAACDGCACLSLSGLLEVIDVLKLSGDVDLLTGDLNVGGGLHVSGTVRSGFSVQVRGDLQVDQVIEAASVLVGGSLQVKGGIVGAGGSVVQAKGEIRAMFAQNAILRSAADVVLNSDTQSGIECSGRLIAREGGGQLRGGKYKAGQGLWAVELGSPQGAPTVVHLGEDPTLMRRIAQIRTVLKKSEGGLRKLQRERGVESVKRAGGSMTKSGAAAVRRSMKAIRDSKKRAALLKKRKTELEDIVYGDDQFCVRVDKQIHAGVEIQILGVSMLVTTTRSGGTFYLDPLTGMITNHPPERQ